MLLLAALASSHPFQGGGPGQGEPGMGAIGQRLHVVVDGARIEVAYVAEVPALRIFKEAKAEGAGSDYATRKIEELRGAVRATWNGAPVPLTPVVVLDPARKGDGDFLEFHATGEGALPSSSGTLVLSNGNFPDEGGYFSTEVKLGAGIVCEESTLVEVRGGTLRNNRHAAWVRDEAARDLRLTLRPAHLWEDATGTGALPVRMAGAIPRPPWLLPAAVAAPVLLLGALLVARRLR